MNGYRIRKAEAGDVAFLADTIVAAEKSSSNKLSLATLFDLSEERATALIIQMLNEEVDGCEFSISSFLVTETDGIPAGAIAGWVEGRVDDMPSQLLKSNLIGFTFPEESVRALQSRARIVSGIQIPRERSSLQVEYLFVHPEHRQRGLAARLIEQLIVNARAGVDPPRKAQLQTFANSAAIPLYDRLGFRRVKTFTSDDPAITDYLPFHSKVLLERAL